MPWKMKISIEATYEITIGDQKFQLTREELIFLRDSVVGMVGNQAATVPNFALRTNPDNEPWGWLVPSEIRGNNPDNDGTSIR